MQRVFRFVLAVLLTAPCAAEENPLVRKPVTGTKGVEVAPGEFIEYQEHLVLWEPKQTSFEAIHALPAEEQRFFQRDTTWLSIPWQNREVLWVGFGIPITLRAHEGRLYLIVFDRDSDFHRIRFRYFRQDHNTLAEIPAAEFPRLIATQNLWLKRENGQRNGKPVDEVEAAIRLDPENPDFRDSLTAMIWFQLETGKEYYAMDSVIDQKFLEEYLQKYPVQKLTRIEAEPAKATALERTSVPLSETEAVTFRHPRRFRYRMTRDPDDRFRPAFTFAVYGDEFKTLGLKILLSKDVNGQVKTRDDFAKALNDTVKPFQARSVERDVRLQDLEMPDGFGTYCTLTDRRLADQPMPPPGEFRYLTFGFAKVGEFVLTIRVYSNSRDDEDFKAALALVRSVRFGAPDNNPEGVAREQPESQPAPP